MTLADHRPVSMTEFAARGRQGRRFEPIEERELDADLRALAERLPNAEQGLLGVAEFAGPRGIPDLLVVARGFDALKRRLSCGVPFIESPADCAVVAALAVGQSRGVDAVAAVTGMSGSQVDRRLRGLMHTGAVYAHGSGFRRTRSVDPIGRTYAFEAKVSDWRRGLSQALRYSSWADASSLVLLKPPGDVTDLAERCAAFNIGLAVRDSWIRRPKLGQPQRALRLEASERLASEVRKAGLEPLANGVGVEHR